MKKCFSFNLKDNKNQNSKPNFTNNQYSRFFSFVSIIILLNKIISINNTNSNNLKNLNIEQLYNFYIKIFRYKKIISTICNLQKIYINLLKPYNLFLLLKKPYVILFFNEFIYKSSVLFFWSKDSFLILSNFDYYVSKKPV